MKYNKLVRDKIPNIIYQDGKVAVFHTAPPLEYFFNLTKKLGEEAQEFTTTPSPEELVDVLEVVYALSKYLRISRPELEKLRKQKIRERGGFTKRIMLEEVLENESK